MLRRAGIGVQYWQMGRSGFADVASGREHWRPGQWIPRHRHCEAYAAIVLAGGYEECGSGGRFRVGPADVLIHPWFDAHLDRFPASGACILNLMLPDAVPGLTLGRVADPDAIVRLAERDLTGARELLCEQLRGVQLPPTDCGPTRSRCAFEPISRAVSTRGPGSSASLRRPSRAALAACLVSLRRPFEWKRRRAARWRSWTAANSPWPRLPRPPGLRIKRI